MPNDAKFGLVVGVGIVIAVAIIYFRKEPAGAATGTEPAAAAVQPARATPPAPNGGTSAHHPAGNGQRSK